MNIVSEAQSPEYAQLQINVHAFSKNKHINCYANKRKPLLPLVNINNNLFESKVHFLLIFYTARYDRGQLYL